MTFPIDFWQHPKVARLSDSAFRAFVESNGHSRMIESDGRLEAEDAEFLWDKAALEALVRSHPTRPLMLREDDAYVLRDYAEHQFTKADRDELSRKRSEAGAKGAAARDANRQALAKQTSSKPKQAEAEIGIGIGIGIGITTSKEVGTRKRASTVPLNFKITDELRAWGKENTPLVDLDAKLPEFIDYWQGTGKVMKDWVSTWRNGMRKQQEFAERDAAKRPPKPVGKIASNDEWMYR